MRGFYHCTSIKVILKISFLWNTAFLTHSPLNLHTAVQDFIIMRWKTKILKSHSFCIEYMLYYICLLFTINHFIYSRACFIKFISPIFVGQIRQYLCTLLERRKNVYDFIKGSNFEVRGNLFKRMF